MLETPLGPAEDTDVWKTEIGVLNRLVGMNAVAAKKKDGEEKEKEEGGKEEENEGAGSDGRENEVMMEELVEEVRSVVRKSGSKK